MSLSLCQKTRLSTTDMEIIVIQPIADKLNIIVQYVWKKTQSNEWFMNQFEAK
jgi:hypothetical protein